MKELPARLTAEQISVLIGCRPHDVPILVRKGLLKPLGKPSQQSVKYFAAIDIEIKARDARWLDKITDALYSYWRSARNQADEGIK